MESSFSSWNYSLSSNQEPSLHSEDSVTLIGWSYQRTAEGEYIIKSKEQFKERYVN